jgi:hypothetical protein
MKTKKLRPHLTVFNRPHNLLPVGYLNIVHLGVETSQSTTRPPSFWYSTQIKPFSSYQLQRTGAYVFALRRFQLHIMYGIN